MTSIEWDRRMREFAVENDMGFGAAVAWIASRDTLEIGVELLGCAPLDGAPISDAVLTSLGSYLEHRGYAPPKARGRVDNIDTRKGGHAMAAPGRMRMTKAEVVQLMDEGHSLREIAQRAGVTEPSIVYHLRRWGVAKDASRGGRQKQPTTTQESTVSITRERPVSVSVRLTDYPVRETLQALIDDAHQTAVEHGWHDTSVPLPVHLALIHSEVSEALQADRKGEGADHVAEELADVVIRVMDTAAAHGFDLASTIIAKMQANKARPHRHGGRKY